MNIAILGANSHIAKDLIESFDKQSKHHLILFGRRPEEIRLWMQQKNINKEYEIGNYENFAQGDFDTVINFVGVGDPAKAKAMGASIFDITYHYDQMVLNYLKTHKQCRYIFISSGAIFGANAFDKPVDENSKSIIDINNLQPHDYYGLAKLYAEARHRAMPEYTIIDVRIFNYLSQTIDINSRFLIVDIFRALKNKEIFETSSDNIYRDYIGRDDFYKIISLLLQTHKKIAVDCYSAAPIGKIELLKYLAGKFELQVDYNQPSVIINGTGYKYNYYSNNKLLRKIGYQPKDSSLSLINSVLENQLI